MFEVQPLETGRHQHGYDDTHSHASPQPTNWMRSQSSETTIRVHIARRHCHLGCAPPSRSDWRNSRRGHRIAGIGQRRQRNINSAQRYRDRRQWRSQPSDRTDRHIDLPPAGSTWQPARKHGNDRRWSWRTGIAAGGRGCGAGDSIPVPQLHDFVGQRRLLGADQRRKYAGDGDAGRESAFIHHRSSS